MRVFNLGYFKRRVAEELGCDDELAAAKLGQPTSKTATIRTVDEVLAAIFCGEVVPAIAFELHFVLPLSTPYPRTFDKLCL